MWKDLETNEDLLGYKVHSMLLKNVVLKDEMLPLSIGVFGNWGSGKSSLMLLLQKDLDEWIVKKNSENRQKTDKILQITFNSWQFENYENTKLTLMENILFEIVNDIKKDKDFFEKADELIGKINKLSVGVLILKKIAGVILPDKVKELLPTKDDLKGLIEEDDYNELLKEVSVYNTSRIISRFRQDFEKIVIEANYKAIIVYIDDLDRCAPERVIECLEAVKLFLNVSRTAFIIGADERIIEYAIEKHYPVDRTKEKAYSPFSDYLEKLIQLPYKLPKLSRSEQETYILLLLCKQKLTALEYSQVYKMYLKFRENDKHTRYDLAMMKADNPTANFVSVERMVCIIPLMLNFLNGNPRQLKRFLNTLDIRLELANVANFNDIKSEILVKLMTLEYNPIYRARFEELYEKQIIDGYICDIKEIEEQANAGTIITTGWKERWDSDILKGWLKATPSLVNINLRNYFWISRESLKDAVPVESLISSHVNAVFERLSKHVAVRTLKPELERELSKFADEAKDQFAMLLNMGLKKNPTEEHIWRIVNSDENNRLLGVSLDRCKLIFEGVSINEIDAQAGIFFKRAKIINELKDYIQSLPINKRLDRAIKQ